VRFGWRASLVGVHLIEIDGFDVPVFTRHGEMKTERCAVLMSALLVAIDVRGETVIVIGLSRRSRESSLTRQVLLVEDSLFGFVSIPGPDRDIAHIREPIETGFEIRVQSLDVSTDWHH
jgi:hypothetical protein